MSRPAHTGTAGFRPAPDIRNIPKQMCSLCLPAVRKALLNQNTVPMPNISLFAAAGAHRQGAASTYDPDGTLLASGTHPRQAQSVHPTPVHLLSLLSECSDADPPARPHGAPSCAPRTQTSTSVRSPRSAPCCCFALSWECPIDWLKDV